MKIRLLLTTIFLLSVIVSISSCTNTRSDSDSDTEKVVETTIAEENSTSSEILGTEDDPAFDVFDTVILPTDIFADVTMITTRLEVSCNAHGVPLDLEQTNVSVNDEGNYVITYNLKEGNVTNDNKLLFLIYSQSGKIQSFNITFLDSTRDLSQLLTMIEYILQVQELNIPVEEANEVYAIFNDPGMSSVWTEEIGRREYTWMYSKGSNGVADMQLFSVDYLY